MTDGRNETEKERLDRNLNELLGELRVIMPGVQVLFAFLLILPFSQGFPKLGDLDRDIFFVAFITTAVSTVLLIAPSSYHRLRWRQHDKERMLVVSNWLTIAGLFFLAVAITCTVFVITDFLFHRSWAAAFTALIAATFLILWYGLPLGALLRDRQKSRRAR
jgi:Kef-type K+ transport system membrane component KefB